MISPLSTTAGTGLDWVTSARLVLTAPSAHVARGQLCPQSVEQQYDGLPVTPVTAVRRRQGDRDLSTMKINKFDFPYHQGFTVWRPPV